jgi:site-specific DNA recombinase
VRVATYARVSSESQEARGTIGSQLEALREKLSQLGHEIVQEYKDDGYSGARLDRPGLDALRDAAELGIFEQVWCLTPDRLARSYAYQILITDELARYDVQICFLDAPPVRDDPEATLLVQVQGVIAEYEKAKIAERNRRGRLFRARAGEIVYRLVPYGYRRIPRGVGGPAHLEIYEPEAVVVRGIFDDFIAGGLSMRRICRQLYEDGVLSPTGKSAWSIACLSKMLSNPTYMGRARYNQHQALPPTTGRKSTRNKLRPPEEWIEIAVPTIVTEEVFEAAQRVSRDHSYFSPRRSRPDQWLLRRLVVCGHCGVKTHCQGTVGSSGRELRYYVCNRRRSLEAGGPERACPQPSTRAEELDALVWEQLCQALLHPGLLLQGEATLSARSPQPDDELLSAQLARLDRRLQEIESERRRLTDLYQMGALELTEFQTRNREVVGRRQKLQREREELTSRRKELAAHNRLAGRVNAFAGRVRHGMESLDFEGRQRLVRLLVEEVRVTGPKVEIHVRMPLDEPPPETDPGRDAPGPQGGSTGLSTHIGLRQLGFDLIDPGAVGGGVVDVESGMPEQPAPDQLGLVGAVVVED